MFISRNVLVSQPWLDSAVTSMTDVYSATKPYSGSDLVADRVSDAVNGKKIDAPDLIRAIS